MGVKRKESASTLKKSKPTEADLQAAQRLRSIWDALPRKQRPSQEDIAAAFTPEISQSAVSQYRNGEIALNFTAVLIFAAKLGCSTEDIRDDLQEFELLRKVGWHSPGHTVTSPDEIAPTKRVQPFPASSWPFPMGLKAQFDTLHAAQREAIAGVLEGAIDAALGRSVHRPPREKKRRPG